MRKDTKKGPRKNLARTLLSIVNFQLSIIFSRRVLLHRRFR